MSSVPDDGRGALAHWIDYVFGTHWHQRVQSVCGYLQAIIGAIAGGSILSSQIAALGLPWLDHNWPKITGWALILSGLLSAIAKRMSRPVETQ